MGWEGGLTIFFYLPFQDLCLLPVSGYWVRSGTGSKLFLDTADDHMHKVGDNEDNDYDDEINDNDYNDNWLWIYDLNHD